jgi:Peptidase family M1 domain
MGNQMRILLGRRLCWLLLLFWLPAWAAPGQTRYGPEAAFAPNFLPLPGNGVRAADGAPGPAYWQNRADYQVEAALDPKSCEITGQVTIDYLNNSPVGLPFVWLELDQNIDREDSRANRMNQPGRPNSGENGFRFQSVERFQRGHWAPATCIVCGTRMQVRLEHPLRPGGGRLRLRIKYNYHLPVSGGGGRSGILQTKNGRIFEVSYWYPRMRVFDDVHGWNTLPFLGEGEFYLDYGNIDYRVTVPRDMIVAGAGRLMNPDEVLTPAEMRRLQKARGSDRTVFIRRPGEAGASGRDQVTWHFRMDHTRDVAWAASRAFVWDAARINLPGERHALAMSFYPVESGATDSWGRATEYLKNSVEIFSRDWFVYPYPVAIEVAGRVGGMEFPGLTFDGWKAKNKSLWSVLSHEIGHTWFPMIVGSDERRDAWMDEGFNTFIDVYASEQFNHGEYAPKRDGEYAPHGGNPAEEIVPVMQAPNIPPIMSLADTFPGRDLHPVEYFKTAFGLVLLREVILGHDRFDYAFRRYIADWAFKHPTPWDFFRAMDNGAGEDLSWFWRGWFEHNWHLDQAVESVKSIKGNPANGAEIAIANLRRLPMPVLAEITEVNGAKQRIRLPVETWEHSGVHTFRVSTTHKLKSVVLDPDHVLPDVDRANNVWKAAARP